MTKNISILSKELVKQLEDFYLRKAILNAGYDNIEKWCDWSTTTVKNFGILPRALFNHSRIYTGNPDTFIQSMI